MKNFFEAGSIAVIGVSSNPTNLGRSIMQNLLKFQFPGVIYPVGPKGGHFLGHEIYTSVEEIGRPIDLGVILTPARTVPDYVRACGRAGIRRVVIESGGFAEKDEDGARIAADLKEAASEYGIRFMGPNGIGTMNTDAGLCVGFPIFPINAKGATSIIAQSGGVGLSYLITFASESVGVAKFASVGNKMDVDENDVLEYLIDDPLTSRIICYLESFSDGRRFCDLISKTDKPVLVHKSNTSALSQSIAASHTTAMLSDDKVADAALKQCGAKRIHTIKGAIDGAKIFSLPLMKGTRVGVVSRSGGHAVIAADTCARRGFTLPAFDPRVLSIAQRYVRAGVIRMQNPLDLGDLFEIPAYKEILSDILEQPQIDGVVFLLAYFYGDPRDPESLFDYILEITARYQKPIALVLETWPDEVVRMKKYTSFPIFDTAEEAVEALYVSHEHHRRLKRRSEHTPRPRADRAAASAVIERGRGRPHLGSAAWEVLAAYGIPGVDTRPARTEAQAARAASDLGYPVAVKVESPEASHKTDVAGVALKLNRPSEVKAAFRQVRDSLLAAVPGAQFEGVTVQAMAKKGLELIVGAARDKDFGPVVILGWGGIVAEALGPPIIRRAPVSRREALRMIDELPARKIMDGLRNRPASDVNALADIIVRAAALIHEQENLSEMDLNPVRVYPRGEGALVLDARMIVRCNGHLKTSGTK